MNPLLKEQIEIIRRIAERGLSRAQAQEDGVNVDLFQHLLDEIERLEAM